MDWQQSSRIWLSRSCGQYMLPRRVSERSRTPQNGKWQVALHDLRNLTKRLHVLEHHAEEVFQIGCAAG